jgi:ketosteroid isomerase-like protein
MLGSAVTDLRELTESWARAVSLRDLDGVVANHTDDVVFFDVVPPIELRGIDAYRASWPEFFAWLGDHGLFELRNLEFTAGEDVAFCHGTLRCGRTLSSDALTIRLTLGFRKVDGAWRIAHEHHSEPSRS